MRTTLRISYDTIAHLYDGQPFREKTVDPELVTFIAQRTFPNRPSILDIACGTGSQLVANRSVVPDALLIGLDRSLGMLRQAQPKLGNIAWVQADAAMLPFEPRCFDFISCQFAFHHVRDKSGMLGAVLEVLRHGGRFVMLNLCPQECPDWLYYEYFPQAHTIDLEDFWPPEKIVTTMEATGFARVTVELEHLRFAQDLCVWLDAVRRRDSNSQLMTIFDRAYEAGTRRLERELAGGDAQQVRADHLCLLTIRGDRGRDG